MDYFFSVFAAILGFLIGYDLHRKIIRMLGMSGYDYGPRPRLSFLDGLKVIGLLTGQALMELLLLALALVGSVVLVLVLAVGALGAIVIGFVVIVGAIFIDKFVKYPVYKKLANARHCRDCLQQQGFTPYDVLTERETCPSCGEVRSLYRPELTGSNVELMRI